MDLRHPSWPCNEEHNTVVQVLLGWLFRWGFFMWLLFWNMVFHVVQASFWLLPWRQWPSPWVPLLHKLTVSPKCFDIFDRSHNSKTDATHM